MYLDLKQLEQLVKKDVVDTFFEKKLSVSNSNNSINPMHYLEDDYDTIYEILEWLYEFTKDDSKNTDDSKDKFPDSKLLSAKQNNHYERICALYKDITIKDNMSSMVMKEHSMQTVSKVQNNF